MTQNYPAWYKNHTKNPGKDDNMETKGPAQKRCRTTTKGNNTGDFQTDPETDIEPNAFEEDSDIMPCLGSMKISMKDLVEVL